MLIVLGIIVVAGIIGYAVYSLISEIVHAGCVPARITDYSVLHENGTMIGVYITLDQTVNFPVSRMYRGFRELYVLPAYKEATNKFIVKVNEDDAKQLVGKKVYVCRCA